MKHRFAVPLDDDPEAFGRLSRWLGDHGWGYTEVAWDRYGLSARRLSLRIAPMWGFDAVELRAVSGITLVYDDAERSMGVTMLAEPRDAVPPEPQDTMPMSLTELFADPRLLAERRGGRWRL